MKFEQWVLHGHLSPRNHFLALGVRKALKSVGPGFDAGWLLPYAHFIWFSYPWQPSDSSVLVGIFNKKKIGIEEYLVKKKAVLNEW